MSRISTFVMTSLGIVLLALGLDTSRARAQGLLGLGEMAVGGSVHFGERLDGGGFGLAANFEYASMFEETALGGYIGAEFLASLGYESFGGEDPYGGSMTQGPLVFDLQVGFPVTLFKIGSGAPGTTLFTVGLGCGMGVQHAYGYVRSRILTAVGPKTYVELMGRWTPSEASSDWTERTGLDLYEARVSVITPIGDLNLQFFGEWSTGDRARVGPEDQVHWSRAPSETVTSFQSIWRVGVGFIF
jgi:hypothetical protein